MPFTLLFSLPPPTTIHYNTSSSPSTPSFLRTRPQSPSTLPFPPSPALRSPLPISHPSPNKYPYPPSSPLLPSTHPSCTIRKPSAPLIPPCNASRPLPSRTSPAGTMPPPSSFPLTVLPLFNSTIPRQALGSHTTSRPMMTLLSTSTVPSLTSYPQSTLIGSSLNSASPLEVGTYSDRMTAQPSFMLLSSARRETRASIRTRNRPAWPLPRKLLQSWELRTGMAPTSHSDMTGTARSSQKVTARPWWSTSAAELGNGNRWELLD